VFPAPRPQIDELSWCRLTDKDDLQSITYDYSNRGFSVPKRERGNASFRPRSRSGLLRGLQIIPARIRSPPIRECSLPSLHSAAMCAPFSATERFMSETSR